MMIKTIFGSVFALLFVLWTALQTYSYTRTHEKKTFPTRFARMEETVELMWPLGFKKTTTLRADVQFQKITGMVLPQYTEVIYNFLFYSRTEQFEPVPQ